MNIRDIAAAAHVSISTVSKVINHKDKEISDATRQKVLKIIKEYQYTPYSNLKEIPTGFTSQTIAFFIQPSVFPESFLFHAEQAAYHCGYSLLICSIAGSELDAIRKYMKIMEARKVSGILLALSSPDFIEEAVRANTTGIPITAISCAPSASCSVFHYNYEEITRKSVSHLIQLGHKKIGCILDAKDTYQQKQCISGYEQALHTLNYQDNHSFILSAGSSYDIIHNEISRMLHSRVTAFFCQTPSLANAVYGVCKEANYYIPNNISVICGENCPQSRYLLPTLASYSIFPANICAQAVDYLVSCIETRNVQIPKSFSFEAIYTEGASISTPPSISKQILVAGNCTIDIMIHTPRIPAEGDLLTSNSMTAIPGGKCVSQAVGAGKLGGSVYALGCVGGDSEGNDVYNCLKEAFVHVEGITAIPSASTGKSIICVPEKGNSSVVAYPGANQVFQISHIRPFRHLFATASYCLISTEINPDVTSYLIKKCEKNNIEIFIKPSSIQHFPDELLPKVTYFVPNAKELNVLFPGEASIPEKAETIFRHGCQNVIVTLGGEGCYLKNAQYAMYIPAADFNALDTTGAANCFIAAIAVSLSKNASLLYAICYATFAAGISITQEGVQTSFPDKSQLEVYMDEIQDMYLSLLQST